jgi:predicted RNase H-like nuclease
VSFEFDCDAPFARLLGGDGCRAGWLVVGARLDPSGEFGQLSWSLELEAASFIDADLVAIDMPMGLAADGPRPCDQQARALLGPRRSSVFPSPVRAALGAVDYREACNLSFAASGRKLSKQAYNLLPKIRQLDQLLLANPGRSDRVHEVHPELAFSQWNGGEPMAHGKKIAAGAAQRQALVEAQFPGLALKIRKGVAKSQLADDDILDAIACLWSARRLFRQGALVLGGERDGCGLPMRISA